MSPSSRAPRAEAPAAPRAAARGLEQRWVMPVVLALFAVLLGALLAHYGFRSWNHTFDEDIYRNLGLWTADHLPGGLWHIDPNISDRGLQRLEGWIFAIGLGGFGSPDGYKITKLLNIACFCSTAIPVWLWTRRMGTGRPAAAAAAALAIAVPWSVITTTFFTESVTYPASAWALFAIWCAAVRPRPATLLAAAAAILVAALGRSVMVLLAALLVVSVVAVALRFGGRAAWASRRDWTARQVAPWALLALAVVVGLGLFAFDRSALAPVTGVYATSLNVDAARIWPTTQRVLSNVLSGGGILPGIVALAWVGRSLVRPARPESFALAVITLGMAALMVYSAIRGGEDERYIMFLAPPVAVCAAVAVARREVGALGVVVATGLVLWLFGSVTWRETSQAYGFLINSAEAFHGRILLLGIGNRLPDVGLSHGLILALGVIVAGAAAAWALRGRGRGPVLLGAALGLGVLALQLAQVVYVNRQFTAEAAYGGPSLAAHTWVDDAVGPHGHVGFYAPRSTPEPALREAWRETAFWNLSADLVLLAADSPDLPGYTNPVARVRIDSRTGRLIAPVPIPRYLLEPRQSPLYMLAGEEVASSYVPMALVRTAQPARQRWLVRGVSADAWVMRTAQARIRVFRDGGTGDCLRLALSGPPSLAGTRTVELISGRQRRTVRVEANRTSAPVQVRLAPGTATYFREVLVKPHGYTDELGVPLGARLDSIDRGACRTP